MTGSSIGRKQNMLFRLLWRWPLPNRHSFPFLLIFSSLLWLLLHRDDPLNMHSYASLFSVMGGVGGYIIGSQFMGIMGWPIIHFYGYESQFNSLSEAFRHYNFFTVLAAALTPIPYKVFTITAGAVSADFMEFFVASAIGRSFRFFAVATLIFFFGDSIKVFIEKYFNLLSVIFTFLLIGGFFIIKYLF